MKKQKLKTIELSFKKSHKVNDSFSKVVIMGISNKKILQFQLNFWNTPIAYHTFSFLKGYFTLQLIFVPHPMCKKQAYKFNIPNCNKPF